MKPSNTAYLITHTVYVQPSWMMRAGIILCLLLNLACSQYMAHAGTDGGWDSKSTYLLDNHDNAVVQIRIITDNGDVAVGTGFYIQKNILATNFHVINGARYIELMVNDKRITIDKIINYDETKDIALLYSPIDGTPLIIGEPDLTPGSKVAAIGYQPVQDKTASEEIGSFKPLVFPGVFVGWEDIAGVRHLKIHGFIHPGMSGGPVIDMSGNVIGLNRLGNAWGASKIRGAIASAYLKKLLTEALQKKPSQFMTVDALFKTTRKHITSKKTSTGIIITD